MGPSIGQDVGGGIVALLGAAVEADATQTHYTGRMKTALIPQVRVEPELRAELEAVLQENESLSEFVEEAVRRAVERRRVETAFHSRGEKAWKAYQRTGHAVPAEEVLAKLQAKLQARRKELLSKR
jgi:predicted transcriptional regulator